MTGRKRKTVYRLRLYIAGQSGRSLVAVANLEKLWEQLTVLCDVQVIDLLKQPALAKKHEIVVIPTLVRWFPRPRRRVLGDLANAERVASRLELPAH